MDRNSRKETKAVHDSPSRVLARVLIVLEPAHATLNVGGWRGGCAPFDPPAFRPMSEHLTGADVAAARTAANARDVVSSLRIAGRQKHGRIDGKA